MDNLLEHINPDLLRDVLHDVQDVIVGPLDNDLAKNDPTERAMFVLRSVLVLAASQHCYNELVPDILCKKNPEMLPLYEMCVQAVVAMYGDKMANARTLLDIAQDTWEMIKTEEGRSDD